MMNLSRKIGILSHILPPSSSGQAVMLYRLLEGIPPELYFLISNVHYDSTFSQQELATRKLAAKYYHFNPTYQISLPNAFKLYIPRFIINSALTINSHAKQIEHIITKENCNTLIACTGDYCDMPSAHRASKKTGINFVPYIFDDYAYQWQGFQRILAKRKEPKLLRNADAIIVTNEFMKEEYMKRYGVECTIVRNPAPDFLNEKEINEISEVEKAQDKQNEKKIKKLVYTGAIYDAHYDAFQSLLSALKKLNGKAELHAYTFTPEKTLIEHGIHGDFFVRHEHVVQTKMPAILNDADFLYLPLAFDSPLKEVIKTSAPGKMGEYMFMSKPIIVHAPKDSFISWYFNKNNCGIVINTKNADEIAKTILNYLDDENSCKELGRRARECAIRDFSIDVSRARFIELLNSL
jgi:glycosyltransferase involved in cell wall biosynthesis